MDNLLNVSPGLIIWTIINFSIFLFIIIKFGAKPIINGLKAREDRINSAIENADKANLQAQKILVESQEKLDNAYKQVSEIVQNGKHQAEEQLQKSLAEAENVKHRKVEEALRDIERSKQNALKELRSEVAGLVITATEKILEEKLDDDHHRRLVDSYINKIPNN